MNLVYICLYFTFTKVQEKLNNLNSEVEDLQSGIDDAKQYRNYRDLEDIEDQAAGLQSDIEDAESEAE